jgi:hypothetical protein
MACTDSLEVKVTDALSDLKIFGFTSAASKRKVEVEVKPT